MAEMEAMREETRLLEACAVFVGNTRWRGRKKRAQAMEAAFDRDFDFRLARVYRKIAIETKDEGFRKVLLALAEEKTSKYE